MAILFIDRVLRMSRLFQLFVALGLRIALFSHPLVRPSCHFVGLFALKPFPTFAVTGLDTPN